MGLIGTFIFWVLVALFGTILAADAQAWSPKLSDFLIRMAIKKLPEEKRQRYCEEWASYIDETPGLLGKLFQACGFLIAAEKNRWFTERTKRVKRSAVVDHLVLELEIEQAKLRALLSDINERTELYDTQSKTLHRRNSTSK